MYNSIHIEKFIDKVHELAAIEAQKVYDLNQPTLLKMINNQLQPGDKLYSGMGSVSLESKKEGVGEKLTDVLTRLEYWDQCAAGFNLPSIINK